MKTFIVLWLVATLAMMNFAANAAGLNNPGNIEKGQPWVGLSKDQPHKRFAKFRSKEYGYRAMAKILLTYNTKYKLRSVTDHISRYAPPHENPTQNYIAFVAKDAGFTTWSYINVKNENVLFWMIKAMAKFEQGKNFNDSDAVIRKGVQMALKDD